MAHDIVQKIQQMVAKAESTDSAAEAESIMVKVREMLDRHGISLLSVKRHANDYDPVATSRDIYGHFNDHMFFILTNRLQIRGIQKVSTF